MKLNCYVIDDYPSIIRQIKKLSGQTPLANFIGGDTDPRVAVDKLLRGEILADVTFLDIDMPGISGIDLLEPLSKVSLVFLISGLKDYGQQAFEHGASGYLYKPLVLNKFQSAINRAFNLIQSKKTITTIAPPSHYYLPGDGREVRVRVKTDDIWFVESKVNFSVVRLIDKTFHICNLNLTQLSRILAPPYFLRINRSVLVNTTKIIRYDAHDVYLEDDKVFSFGDKYRQEFIQWIRHHGMLY